MCQIKKYQKTQKLKINFKETLNYRNLKTIDEGLFCEKIFGPTKDLECKCKRYKKLQTKIKTNKKILICPKCLIEITSSNKRNYKLG